MFGASGNKIMTRNRPLLLQSLGDSNSARGIYHPTILDFNLTKCPLWTPNTAFILNNAVRNSLGQMFYCTTAGTTGGSEPTWSATSTTADGTAVWTAYMPQAGRDIGSHQRWAEYWSNGALLFDQSTGYAAPAFSVIKVLVLNGGSGYTNPTVVFSPTGGASATATVVNGVITSVDITNCGRNATGAWTASISDPTGTGAEISVVFNNNGSFAVSGTTTATALKLVPDALASKADIITVLSGSNDVTIGATNLTTAETTYQTAIANLRSIYEQLVAGGKGVIAITLAPRGGQDTAHQASCRAKINRFIRAFANQRTWANPNGIEIAIADPVSWTTDTSTGGGAQAGFLDTDNLHYITRMGMVVGRFVAEAAQAWTMPRMTNYPRNEGWADGYSRSYNPQGNMLEGLYWAASTPVVVGDFCNNDTNKVYVCTTAGTTASSGGPTGTGSGIVDGAAQWKYRRAGGISTLANGVGGTNTAAAGIVFTSTPPQGTTLARQNGSATGTVVHSTESPRSDGRAGQRHVMAFSLSGGGATEQWRLLIQNPTIADAGILAADLNDPNKLYTFEVELEISSYTNVYPPFIQLFGQSALMTNYDGYGQYSISSFLGANAIMLPSTHELAWGGTQKMLLRTVPMALPLGLTSLNAAIYFGFDTTTSAAATIKLNHIAIRQLSP